MKDLNSKAFDMFLLMFNLSQLTSGEKIITLFVEALKEIWPGTDFLYTRDYPKNNNLSIIKISTASSNYGFLNISRYTDLKQVDQDLIYNAAAMLAVILNRIEQDRLLADEKLHLEKLVDEKIKAIRESEEKFRNFFEHSIVGKSITAPDGRIETNKAFSEILGYSREELAGINWQDITYKDDIDKDEKIIASIISGKKMSARWEKRYIRKNGDIIWTDISTVLQRDNEGNPLYFITTIFDITEHKRLVAALTESESRYRSMFENNYAVMLLIDPQDGTIVDSNPAASEFYGFDRNNFKGKKMSEISTIDNSVLSERLKFLFTGDKNQFVSKHRVKSGIIRDVEIFCSPIIYRGEKLMHCIIHDITQRNVAMEELNKSLAEKKELISEIYHRTKNNMQVIISMFSLKSMYSEDEKLEKIFKDMENRIRAMSLVHEKLYQSRNLSKLNLKEYLSELVVNILSAYGITDSKISVKNKMENIEVLIDTAIPCGLVVNELVSNVVKHAFPDNRSGEIITSLTIDEADEIELVVSDTGVGCGTLPGLEEIESMGLQIVKNIVEYQLKGKIELSPSAGTKWIIRFSDNVYEERI